MANYVLVTFESGEYKGRGSNASTVDFLSVKVGASALEIKETTGHFDFSAKKLTNIAAGTATGHAVEYDQLNTALADYVPTADLGQPNGVATLDGSGKLPSSQLTIEAFEYKGNWDASTNDPTLADGVGSTGDLYNVSDAGTVDFGSGNITFAVGDKAVYNGTVWEKWVTTAAVSSVNGQTGVVVLDTDDIDEGSTNLYFTVARAKAAAVADAINDGTTDVAPSQNAVFDALALKKNISENYATLTNDNAGSITVGQIVYVKPDGDVDLAARTTSGLSDAVIGVVRDASIATTASGTIWIKPGIRITGFTSLTPGKRQYVSTSGALTETAPSASGDTVYEVGRALSATEILFNPRFIITIV